MKLKSGINLGGWLSQCEHGEEHYRRFISGEDVVRIARWGFDHVRLPIDCEVVQTADGMDIESGYAHIDRAVEWCRVNRLSLVLDLHKAYGYDFNDAGGADRNNLFTSEALKARFIGLWKKLAMRYGGYDHVAFELLNEVVEEENNDPWNDLIDRCVTAIRAIAPVTPIIYGGIQWNSSRTLKLLRKPAADGIIYTFHFYEPLLFTHQKAYWVKAIDKNREISYPATMEYYREGSRALGFQGDAATLARSQTMGGEFIAELMSEAVEAAKKAGVPLYCGEFGVIDLAPAEDTLRWFEDVNSVLRENDIGFAVWNYREKDFGIAGEHYDTIRERLLALWNK